MDPATLSNRLRTLFATRPDVVAAYLFGSVARNEARKSSDVDVAVMLHDGRPTTIAHFERVFALQHHLEGALDAPVDLVVMEGAPLDLLHRVWRDGIRVADRDPERRLTFELRARNEYFDLLPILLHYRGAVLGSRAPTPLRPHHLEPIESSLETLARLARPNALETDPVQLGFVEHTLQTAIQAAIDVAALIVTERKLGEPDVTRSLFALLAQDGWLDAADVAVWQRIVGFRNVIVHRYLIVDPRVVRAVLQSNVGDLHRFVRRIRDRLAAG
jgi:uncharacterized protein YutE (UPF0331/DUF86 family)/predicted nucleotidyltransferase